MNSSADGENNNRTEVYRTFVDEEIGKTSSSSPPTSTSSSPSASASSVSTSASTSKEEVSWAVYLCFFMIGSGLELPYHAFITAVDFFSLFVGSIAEFVVTLPFDPTCLVTFFLVMKWGQTISEKNRIVWNFSSELVLLLLINLLVLSPSRPFSILFIVLSMMLVGINTGCLHISVFGFGGRMPPICLQALMAGIGLSGLIVSTLRIINKSLLSADERGTILSARIYFIICAVLIAGCLACYYYVKDLSPSSFPSTSPSSSSSPSTHSSEELQDWKGTLSECWLMSLVVLLTYIETFFVFPGLVSLIPSSRERLNEEEWFATILILLFNLGNFLGSTLTRPWLAFWERRTEETKTPLFDEEKKKEQKQEIELIRRTRGQEGEKEEETRRTGTGGESEGEGEDRRTLGQGKGDEKEGRKESPPGKTLWIWLVIRLPILAGLIVSYKPRWIEEDIMVYIMVSMLSLSNGFVGTLGVVYGPEWCSTPKRKETAAQVVSVCYNIGIAVGTTLSFPAFAFL